MTSLNDSKKAFLIFFLEVVTGTLIFLVIGAAAVGLGLFLDVLKTAKIDPIVLGGLYLAKYGLFAADLLLFARFMCVTSLRAWKSL